MRTSLSMLPAILLILLVLSPNATHAQSQRKKKPLDAVGKIAATIEPTQKIVYKTVGDRKLELHIFKPAGLVAGDQRACFLVIHGGGWGGGEPRRLYPFAEHFAKRGMVSICIQYRLLEPKAGVSVFECVKDGRSAVRYVRQHAAELGINPQKIIVCGASAGGHIAAATALLDKINEAGEDTTVSCAPNALVLHFPVIDTSKDGYGNKKLGARWKELSPLLHVRADMPPTLIQQGSGDTTTKLSGAEAFRDAMLKAGNRCDLLVNKGGMHGYMLHDVALYEESLRQTEDFLVSLGMLDSSGATLSPDELYRLRKAAAQRQRRIIYNNDGNDCLTTLDQPRTHESFLQQRTTAIAGSQVDSIFYCTGLFNLYFHHSKETEGRVIKPRGEGKSRREDWGWELGTKGPDTLATMVDFGQKNNMEVFWSMRMNDTHDTSDPSTLSQWKKAHPELLMDKQENRHKMIFGGKRWSALNYEKAEVREKVLRIIRDVATRYDVDGLELDFMRSPVFFKSQSLGKPVTQAERDMMTDLLHRIRKMADETAAKRGRPMLVAVRVPDSVQFASALGLDIERWMKDDLIDVMAVSCFCQLNPWEVSVKLGHKYGVPVYPSLSEPRFKNVASKLARESLECYRGRALDAWNAGADGIYMFNFFDPQSTLWHEVGDRQSLKTKDQLYPAGSMGTTSLGWLSGGINHMNLPLPLPENPKTIKPGEKAVVPINVAADLSGDAALQPNVEVRLLVEKNIKASNLKVRFNGQLLSVADPVAEATEPLADAAETRGKPRAQLGATADWPAFAVDPSILKRGINRLEVSVPPGGKQTTLLDAVVLVRFPAKAADGKTNAE